MSSKNNDNTTDMDNDEIIYDNEDNFNTLSDATKKIQKLKEDLEVCRNEKQEYLDGWQRSKADFVNLKKRGADDLLEIRERAAESFIFDLLPVLDSFDMAFKNKEAWESAPEQWRRGVEYIHTQLKTLLENNQVKIIDPLNKDFDPNEHHSAMNVKIEDESQEGKVVDVILKGYKIKDRVLRPAHVKVGSFED
jgi:molecular chaperone GrpE